MHGRLRVEPLTGCRGIRMVRKSTPPPKVVPATQTVCFFFLDPKKNHPMQGQVAPGDYDGQFQGATSKQVGNAAFGYGTVP